MNNIDTNQLLAQLRLAAAQAHHETPKSQGVTEGANFSSLLKQSIDKVNDLQQDSSQLKTAFELGDPGVQLADTMVASSKAGLAFQGMLQVRNKLVEAYQEIMRMQV